MTTTVTCIKQLFSKDPEAAVLTAANSKDPVWAIFGAAYALLMGIFVRMFTGNALIQIMRSAMDAAGGLANDIFGFGGGFGGGLGVPDPRMVVNLMMGPIQMQLIFISVFLGALSIVLYAVCLKLMHVAQKIDVPFTKMLNLVAGASLLPSAAMAAAILISFISAIAALFLVGIAGIVFYCMFYAAAKQITPFKTSPLWVFLATLAGSFLIYFLVSHLLFRNMYTNILMGMMF